MIAHSSSGRPSISSNVEARSSASFCVVPHEPGGASVVHVAVAIPHLGIAIGEALGVEREPLAIGVEVIAGMVEQMKQLVVDHATDRESFGHLIEGADADEDPVLIEERHAGGGHLVVVDVDREAQRDMFDRRRGEQLRRVHGERDRRGVDQVRVDPRGVVAPRDLAVHAVVEVRRGATVDVRRLVELDPRARERGAQPDEPSVEFVVRHHLRHGARRAHGSRGRRHAADPGESHERDAMHALRTAPRVPPRRPGDSRGCSDAHDATLIQA
ncbi:MAG: hypothetical protein NT062_15440 [Proteobacteria bacterium]|nr:hypothetical protein [Pseudomonadota bacterium]